MYRILSLALLSTLAAASARSQTHFVYTSGTGNNATLVIPLSAAPTLGTNPLESGDEIAVVTPAGLVVGATVWTGTTNVSLTVNGDDEIGTPSLVDGIKVGETLAFRVWDASTAREYSSVSVTYSSAQPFYRTDGRYAVNALYALASLTVTLPAAPLAPSLVSPQPGQANVARSPVLVWSAASGATSYDVQVAASADFLALAASVSGVAGTSVGVGPLSVGATYHWRARAVNEAGASPWTDSQSFTTRPAGVALEGPASSSAASADVYPNPARGHARIRYALPAASPVRVTVLDGLGRTVAVLADVALQGPGLHEAAFDARSLPAGVYVVRVQTPAEVLTRVLLLQGRP